jgi:hypothetical protein
MIVTIFNKRIRLYRNRFVKKQKIKSLQDRLYSKHTEFKSIWCLNTDSEKTMDVPAIFDSYTIYGYTVPLNNINWHRDYVSGFEYPVRRFDKIKISDWYDKGIDVKYPWELSRFYFAIPIAQNYYLTNDERYYHRFKYLVENWLENNPFLYGVNWHCTMEVAIRAVNWIVALNLMYSKYQSDKEFYIKLSKSLVQHARYIDAFPEVKIKGTANNHLIADYFGLLFLALTLRDHPESDKWLQISTQGLVKCIETQLNDDGTSFEGSIPYHRLVLEMFGYTAILCRANDVELPVHYYRRLFRMFEFSAAYMDHNGNAPQIGDNDSGRTIIFHGSDEHDHSYLLNLGECLFKYKFKSQCQRKNEQFIQWLPTIKQIVLSENPESEKISAFSD